MSGAIQIQSVGDLPGPFGTEKLNLSISIPNPILNVETLNLTATPLQPRFAGGATVMIFIPPPTNVIPITLLHGGGDPGGLISPNLPLIFGLAQAFLLSSTAAVTCTMVSF